MSSDRMHAPSEGSSRRRASHHSLTRLVLAPMLVLCATAASCSAQSTCSNSTTREALDLALDKLYAEARQIAKVTITINDIIEGDRAGKQKFCKALIHLSVNVLEIQKQEHDVTVEYTVETTESGRTFVSITSPS